MTSGVFALPLPVQKYIGTSMLMFLIASLVQVAFNVIVWSTVLLPLLLISLPVWVTSRFLVWLSYGNERKQATGIEAAFLHEEDASKSIVSVFMVLAGENGPDMDNDYNERLVRARKKYTYLAFLSCPEMIDNYFFWRKKNDVNINDHFHVMEGLDLKRTYTMKEALDLYGEGQANAPFAKDKPMWEILYIPKVTLDEGDMDEADQKCCLILRAHHSLLDGISLAKFMNEFMLDSAIDYNPIPPLPHVPPWQMFLLQACSIINMPWATTPMMLRRLWNSSRLPALKGRKIIHTTSLDIEAVRFIKDKAGCYFSEVIIASVGASLQEFFSQKKFSPKVIRSLLSLAFPSDDESIITNNFSLVTIPFSGEHMDPLQRLRDTQKMVEKMKQSLDVFTFYWFLRIFGYLLPSTFFRRMILYLDAFAVVTYVPGRGPVLYHRGNKIVDFNFIAQHRDRTGITITSLTYLQRLKVSFCVDEGLLTDKIEVEKMANAFYKNTMDLANQLGYQKLGKR